MSIFEQGKRAIYSVFNFLNVTLPLSDEWLFSMKKQLFSKEEAVS